MLQSRKSQNIKLTHKQFHFFPREGCRLVRICCRTNIGVADLNPSYYVLCLRLMVCLLYLFRLLLVFLINLLN